VSRTALTLTDGGMETTLIFHQGVDLPEFAAFPLLEDESGRAVLRRYFAPFFAIADDRGLPFVLDTPTWRANPDWAAKLGYDGAALDAVNAGAVRFAREVADGRPEVLINGVVGPRGDGYAVADRMSADEAAGYHGRQIAVLAEAGAERITAMTLAYPDEAIGILEAAGAAGVPAVVSFTVETDGRLPDGTPVAAAVERVDAATGRAAEFFMINCAHPTHIASALDGAPALERIGGLRVNASTRSHAELDAADDLDEGDPTALGRDHAGLRAGLPAVGLLGGCCGTDHRHVESIVEAWDGR
jgi:S-methylmethionine-dependent homocysteine/selenocysteine methylase